jgi:hypothetical protein
VVRCSSSRDRENPCNALVAADTWVSTSMQYFVVLDHPLQAPALPLHPAEPGQVVLFAVGVAGHHGPPAPRWSAPLGAAFYDRASRPPPRGSASQVVMTDLLHPGIATRVLAARRGERAAGTGIYQELGSAEQDRAAHLVAADRGPWSAPPAVGTHLVSTWECVRVAEPGRRAARRRLRRRTGYRRLRPAGHLRPGLDWFAAAAGWLSQAQQAVPQSRTEPSAKGPCTRQLEAFGPSAPAPRRHTMSPEPRQHCDCGGSGCDEH